MKKQLPQLEKPHGTYFITFVTWERLELTSPARKVVLDACLFFNQKRYQIYAVVIMPDHVHLLIKPFPRNRIHSSASILLASDSKNLLTSNSKNLVPFKATSEYWSIGSILHSIKSYSAKQIPLVMNHIGKVWQDGRYDEMIRDEREFQIKWEYIRQNPVKAGLSKTPEEYPFFWEIF
ncbi:MAG: transposase [Hydrococcus sp. C42_A2020_068]|nr:transposase [Hydrococcus sp. C42_A2020_068]